MESLWVLIVLSFWLPIWAVNRELRARRSPDYWRRWGAVVVEPRALQARERKIGYYQGAEIFERVRFGGWEYRFDHVAGPDERELIEGGELYLEPGLVYRMREPASCARLE